MLPSFDLNRLNALRQAIYGGGMGQGMPGQGLPGQGMPVQGTAMPSWGAQPPIARAPMPVQAPMQPPVAQPPISGPYPVGGIQMPNQFPNLQALQQFAPQGPQSMMRRPMYQGY